MITPYVSLARCIAKRHVNRDHQHHVSRRVGFAFRTCLNGIWPREPPSRTDAQNMNV